MIGTLLSPPMRVLLLNLGGHLVIGVALLLWWMTRYAGDPEATIRSEYLALQGGNGTTGTAVMAEEHPSSRTRRVSFSVLALFAVLIIGTALPLLTARLAFKAPVNATAPPGAATAAEE